MKTISIMFFCVVGLFLSACNNHSKINLPGYVEGSYSYISTSSSGILKSLNVAPGESVAINQPLFTLDPLPESDELAAAEARIEQAKADQQKSDSNFKLQKTIIDRKTDLYKKNVISKEEYDIAKVKYQDAVSNLSSTSANLAVVEAQLHKAAWFSKQKEVVSPVSAFVFDTYYNVGEFVPNNNPVVSLLAPSNIKVIFYCQETNLSHLKLNQQIEVTCDQCKKPIKAKITFISPKAEYTPPVIYSREVRTKLTYRIEALPLASKETAVLHPGQPITVELNLQDEM